MPILGVIYWVLYQLLNIPFIVIGWFALIPMAVTKSWYWRYSYSKLFVGRPVRAWEVGHMLMSAVLSGCALGGIFSWSIAVLGGLFGAAGTVLAVWDNEEDGVVPSDYINGRQPYMIGRMDQERAYAWSAWRNPTAGWKNVWGASAVMSDKLWVKSFPGGFVAVDGWRFSIGALGVRIGWQMKPTSKPGDTMWPVAGHWKS